jgi:hypothetical protein
MEAPLDRSQGKHPVPAAAPVAAFFAGGALALVTSGGIVEERLSSGSLDRGVVVNALMTVASIGLLVLVQRRVPRTRRVLIAQAFGALLGILGVHLALRSGVIAGAPWLSERPAQLVNDVVAVFAVLAVVWACAERLDWRLLAAAALLVVLYRATGKLWHLDVAPHGFVVSVQDLVMAQCVGAAVALLLYRNATLRRD